MKFVLLFLLPCLSVSQFTLGGKGGDEGQPPSSNLLSAISGHLRRLFMDPTPGIKGLSSSTLANAPGKEPLTAREAVYGAKITDEIQRDGTFKRTIIQIGEMIPDVHLEKGFPPTEVSLRLETEGKNVVLVGLPEATEGSNKQILDYLEKSAELKKAGIDKVIVFAVSDGAAMQDWEEKLGTKGTLVDLMADTDSKLTTALGMGGKQCEPFSALVSGGKIMIVTVAPAEDDPAWGYSSDAPEFSMAVKMQKDIEALKKRTPLTNLFNNFPIFV